MADYYFIVNCKSRTGKAKEIWDEIKEELRAQNIDHEAYVTEYKGHATELAQTISALDMPQIKLIVVGGDGTINEVLNGITDFDKMRMGFIPTGSGNDFGKGMGYTATPIQQLKKLLQSKQTTSIDLGCVSWNENQERRIFSISSGIGLDADVCKQALTTKMKNVLNAVGLGKLTYVLLTIKTLFVMQTASASITTDTGIHIAVDKMICMVAMNLPYEGGGIPMAPGANAGDGMLSFCCISGIPKWKAFFCLPFLVLGKHKKIKGFTVLNCREADIKIHRKMIVHADGEYCGERDTIHFSCLPDKLNVIG